MANYYYVTIKSENVTQDLAAEILNEMVNRCKIRHFSFNEGFLQYNTRNIVNVAKILANYDIKPEEIEVKDEFELMNKEG